MHQLNIWKRVFYVILTWIKFLDCKVKLSCVTSFLCICLVFIAIISIVGLYMQYAWRVNSRWAAYNFTTERTAIYALQFHVHIMIRFTAVEFYLKNCFLSGDEISYLYIFIQELVAIIFFIANVKFWLVIVHSITINSSWVQVTQ